MSFVVDNGKEYGSSGLVHKITHEHNEEELTPLVAEISREFAKRDIISVGDWGGGNGILTMQFHKMLSEYDLKVDILDIDSDKFCHNESWNNVLADIRIYKPKIRYDYSMTRHTLHYMQLTDQFRFVQNMFDSTRFGALIINYSIEPNQWWQRRELELTLKKLTGIERFFVNHDDICNMVCSASWNIVKDATYVMKDFDYRLFFKQRYALEEDTLNELDKSKSLISGDYKTTVLFCKP